MSGFPFAASTQVALKAFLKRPSQSLLVSGEAGVGVEQVAAFLGARLGNDTAHRLEIHDENGTIPIERIRSLYGETKATRRDALAVIIHRVECMGVDAQNSFLKLLEEPPAKVHFIMTTHQKTGILPTILSRVQEIEVHRISDEQSQQLVEQLCPQDTTRQQRALFLASGRPSELKRICVEDEYYQSHVERIDKARKWLSANAFDRLVITQQLGNDRDAQQAFVETLGQLLVYSSGKSSLSDSSVRMLSALDGCADALEFNGNAKLHLLKLVWHS